MNPLFLEAGAAGGAGGGLAATLISFLPIVAMLVLLYFVMLRPQQKKEKKSTEMRNSIEIGDEITTIGGIIGRVASIKEDTFVLETGADRVKIRFRRWAIQDVQKLNLEAGTAEKETK